MIINTPTPYGYAVICDDIRHETSGKVSLIGTYTGSMTIHSSLPTVLPKLCFAIRYIEKIDDETEPVEIRVYMPGDGVDTPSISEVLSVDNIKHAKEKFRTEPESDDPKVTGHLFIVQNNAEIREEGRIYVRAIKGDNEYRLGGLTVKSAPTRE